MKRIFFLLTFCALSVSSVTITLAQNYKRLQNEIYATSGGVGFLMDVLIPEQPNGIAVVQVVNGSWISSGPAQKATNYLYLLAKGQTVFLVGTGSRPTYKVDEMIGQVQQAVAYIRKNATKYGIRPDAIALTGGSSGGVIGLMAVVTAPDSAKVQAGAFFYPGTDLMHWSAEGGTFYTNPPTAYKRRCQAFHYQKEDDSVLVHKELRKMSAIHYVNPQTPPILLIHGTADTVIPIHQSQIFIAKLKENNVPCKLVVYPDKGHGWKGRDKDFAILADWFEQYLKKE